MDQLHKGPQGGGDGRQSNLQVQPCVSKVLKGATVVALALTMAPFALSRDPGLAVKVVVYHLVWHYTWLWLKAFVHFLIVCGDAAHIASGWRKVDVINNKHA